jgi:hypothetical protein
MADKDQVRQDEEIVKHAPEAEVTELDDQALDEASGGAALESEALSSSNNNCVC